jgi:hypothetical protein
VYELKRRLNRFGLVALRVPLEVSVNKKAAIAALITGLSVAYSEK